MLEYLLAWSYRGFMQATNPWFYESIYHTHALPIRNCLTLGLPDLWLSDSFCPSSTMSAELWEEVAWCWHPTYTWTLHRYCSSIIWPATITYVSCCLLQKGTSWRELVAALICGYRGTDSKGSSISQPFSKMVFGGLFLGLWASWSWVLDERPF